MIVKIWRSCEKRIKMDERKGDNGCKWDKEIKNKKRKKRVRCQNV